MAFEKSVDPIINADTAAAPANRSRGRFTPKSCRDTH
jgi:hypothetical protein